MTQQEVKKIVSRILKNTEEMTAKNMINRAVKIFNDCALLFDARKEIENFPVAYGWDSARIHFLFGVSMLGRSEASPYGSYRKLTPCRSFRKGEEIDADCIFFDKMNMSLAKAYKKKKTREEFFGQLSKYLKTFQKLLDTRWIKLYAEA